MIEYSFDILNLEVYSQYSSYSQCVHKINWQLTATDGEHAVSHAGQTELALSSEIVNYVDFSQLTRDQVISWVLDCDHAKVENLKTFLVQQLDQERSPEKVVLDPPWSVQIS